MLGDSVRRRQPQRRQRPKRGNGRKRLGPRFWIPAALAMLVVPFAIGYVVAAYMIFPEPALTDPGIPVPALRGLSTLEAERVLAQAGLGGLEATALPHPDAPEGEVLAQSPLPGQQLPAGRDVRVAVSSGPPRANVPDVLGRTAEGAQRILVRAGFDVTILEGESPVAAGLVYQVEPSVGTQQRLPAVVTLRVSLGPPAVDTLALPDTMPPPAR